MKVFRTTGRVARMASTALTMGAVLALLGCAQPIERAQASESVDTKTLEAKIDHLQKLVVEIYNQQGQDRSAIISFNECTTRCEAIAMPPVQKDAKGEFIYDPTPFKDTERGKCYSDCDRIKPMAMPNGGGC